MKTRREHGGPRGKRPCLRPGHGARSAIVTRVDERAFAGKFYAALFGRLRRVSIDRDHAGVDIGDNVGNGDAGATAHFKGARALTAAIGKAAIGKDELAFVALRRVAAEGDEGGRLLRLPRPW